MSVVRGWVGACVVAGASTLLLETQWVSTPARLFTRNPYMNGRPLLFALFQFHPSAPATRSFTRSFTTTVPVSFPPKKPKSKSKLGSTAPLPLLSLASPPVRCLPLSSPSSDTCVPSPTVPPKKAPAAEKKTILGRPGNNLKIGIVGEPPNFWTPNADVKRVLSR